MQCSRRPQQRSRATAAAMLLLLALAVATACVPEDAVESHRPLVSGDAAPPFAASFLDGDTLRLQDLRGAAVMLNIWATWCAPCREEMPGLQALHEEYGDRGLRVVGVSIDSRGAESAIRSFLADHGIDFTILHDPNETVTRQFRTNGVPQTFLIDTAGVVVQRWIGKIDPMAAEVTSRVEEVLPGARAVPGARAAPADREVPGARAAPADAAASDAG